MSNLIPSHGQHHHCLDGRRSLYVVEHSQLLNAIQLIGWVDTPQEEEEEEEVNKSVC